MCPWDMDAPTCTVQLMMKLYTKYQIILPSRSCGIFDDNFLDGRMYRRTLVNLNAADCLLLKFSLNNIFIDPKTLN